MVGLFEENVMIIKGVKQPPFKIRHLPALQNHPVFKMNFFCKTTCQKQEPSTTKPPSLPKALCCKTTFLHEALCLVSYITMGTLCNEKKINALITLYIIICQLSISKDLVQSTRPHNLLCTMISCIALQLKSPFR